MVTLQLGIWITFPILARFVSLPIFREKSVWIPEFLFVKSKANLRLIQSFQNIYNLKFWFKWLAAILNLSNWLISTWTQKVMSAIMQRKTLKLMTNLTLTHAMMRLKLNSNRKSMILQAAKMIKILRQMINSSKQCTTQHSLRFNRQAQRRRSQRRRRNLGLQSWRVLHILDSYHPCHIGEVLMNRYVLIQKLGWGHFSTVWLAKDFKYSTYVAVKIMKSAPHYLEASYDEVMIEE